MYACGVQSRPAARSSVTTSGDVPGLFAPSGGVSRVTPAGSRAATPAATARSTDAESLRRSACRSGAQFKAITTSRVVTKTVDEASTNVSSESLPRYAAPACDGDGVRAQPAAARETRNDDGRNRPIRAGRHVGKVRFRGGGKGPSDRTGGLATLRDPAGRLFYKIFSRAARRDAERRSRQLPIPG